MLKKAIRPLVIAACVLGSTTTHAQDVHFSQFTETPQLLNPGATGVYNGYMRAIINYKNQWTSMGKAFNTEAASFDIPMFDYNERKAHLGAGINFFKDQAGDAKFGLTQANLCIAGIIPANKTSSFSLGVSVGGAQHKADMNSLVWGNQFNGEKFDPSLNSNESTPVNSFMYADIGAGFYYEYFTGKATLDRNEAKRFGIGVAYYHINHPTQHYFSVSEKLYGKMVATFSGNFDKTGTRFSVLPSGMFIMQGKSMEVTAGCAVRYRIHNGTKITGFYNESGVSLGISYRYKDAVIPMVYYEMSNFGVGISYDINTSAYAQASHYNGGAEISLRYFIQKGALFKQKNMI